MIYKGAHIPGRCKNKCYEHRIDEIIQANTIDGNPPKIMAGGGEIQEYRFRLWSARYGRYTRGNSVGASIGEIKFCPICGQRLERDDYQ